MSLRFISDLHLDEKRPALCEAFFHYLEQLPSDTEALYILGDFFEAWIGDDDDSVFHRRIMQKLKEKTASGLPIYFMHGNRDFLVGKFFELHTGCILLNDPFILQYHGKNYLLMHGDSLCTDDTAYQQFRTYIRNPLTQAELLKKSLPERRAIAQQLREKSQSVNQDKNYDIMDVNGDEVLRTLQQFDVNTLIHGHTHRPAVHDLANNCKRIVLGDWHDAIAWEVVMTENDISLHSFQP